MSYDASGGGLRRLARIHISDRKRRSARHLRARAAMYTSEHAWVRKSQSVARKLEKEADILRR